jgi:2',3'-cyclic-nucleotide 2'-phosphodiesterase (5'-nucleotidase family)
MIKYVNIFLLAALVCFQSCGDQETHISALGDVIIIDSLNISHTNYLQDSIISIYQGEIYEEMNQVLVFSEQVMEKDSPEGLLNNFIADLVLEKGNKLYNPGNNAHIDFCLLNYGGLRVPLPKGEITSARVFELLPFENEMVVVTLTGEKTLELFQYLANSDRGMPVSGIQLQIKNNTPESILIQGEEFDITRNYKILTSDYLALGGDNMIFFSNPLNYELLGMRVRDAIIMHMKDIHSKGEKINSQLDGRITIIH